jgi:hypothetical protein
MKRAAIFGAFWVAFALALFVFLHTGPRAGSVCGAEGSYRTGTVSLWPPGAECAGPAPPASTVVVFDDGYWGVLGFATVLLAAVAMIAIARVGRRDVGPTRAR